MARKRLLFFSFGTIRLKINFFPNFQVSTHLVDPLSTARKLAAVGDLANGTPGETLCLSHCRFILVQPTLIFLVLLIGLGMETVDTKLFSLVIVRRKLVV